MTNNKEQTRDEKELTQHDVMVLFRDVVDKLLKTNIHPKDITYSMAFVAAEVRFLSAEDKQDVYTVITDSVLQASENLENIMKETDLKVSLEDEVESNPQIMH
jgi:hypothetical protein